MRKLIPLLFLAAAACSAGTTPETTPPPRQEPSVAPPPSTDADRAAPPPAPVSANRDNALRGVVVYRCAGDRTIETNYADDGTVEVRWNGRWYALRPQEAASGALYASRALRWHTKGDSATLEERGRTVASDCSVRSRGGSN
ncbi:MAG: MliC family protein [Gemmatimonadales bacterium]